MPTLQELMMGMLSKGAEQGSEAVRGMQKHQADLRSLLAGKQEDMARQQAQQEWESPYKQAAADAAMMNARTMEAYRADQAARMEDQSRNERLKLLLGGGTGGVGADGKPLSNEAQKTYNTADIARDSLNQTEAFTKEHPYASAAAAILPGFASKFIGGSVKQAYDTQNTAKESLQNLYTGAAASGEQVPAFQSFAGPGFLDALQGKSGDTSTVRDSINTFQQGLQRQTRPLTPELLQAADLQDDPIAQQAMSQQNAAAQAKQQAQLAKMAPQDQEAHKWLQANPADPAAHSVRQKLSRKYGNHF